MERDLMMKNSGEIKVCDIELIGSFLHCASRGDRVGLNQMLRDGTSPDVQDYDKRTALHLACSEGHAFIVELLIQYNANVNLEDRWERTPLADARFYGYRDICRILEVNGGKESVNDSTFHHEDGLSEVNIDSSELNLEHSLMIEQGMFGTSEKVKWRGTWVAKTIIKTHKPFPDIKKCCGKEIFRLRELRHPNILQFLGAIVHEEDIILITEYLPKGNLSSILNSKVRLDIGTSLRYALDIARNLLLDEGGHLKIGEHWVQMLREKIHPCQGTCHDNNLACDTTSDIYSFARIFYEMLEGCELVPNMSFDHTESELADLEPRVKLSRCSIRIQQLIQDCLTKEHSQRPTFAAVINILEEESVSLAKSGCSVC